jgi:thiol-disulfide isomerase/thioredoxin
MSIKSSAKFLAVIALSLFFLINCHNRTKEQAAPQNTAFSFALKDLQGDLKTLQNYSDKKLIIVDFWATWCPRCRTQIPHLNDVYRKYGDRISLVGISVDKGGLAELTVFVRNSSITYPVLTDGFDLARRYGVNSIPALFMIDPQGTILKRMTSTDEQALDFLIRDLLAKV